MKLSKARILNTASPDEEGFVPEGIPLSLARQFGDPNMPASTQEQSVSQEKRAIKENWSSIAERLDRRGGETRPYILPRELMDTPEGRKQLAAMAKISGSMWGSMVGGQMIPAAAGAGTMALKSGQRIWRATKAGLGPFIGSFAGGVPGAVMEHEGKPIETLIDMGQLALWDFVPTFATAYKGLSKSSRITKTATEELIPVAEEIQKVMTSAGTPLSKAQLANSTSRFKSTVRNITMQLPFGSKNLHKQVEAQGLALEGLTKDVLQRVLGGQPADYAVRKAILTSDYKLLYDTIQNPVSLFNVKKSTGVVPQLVEKGKGITGRFLSEAEFTQILADINQAAIERKLSAPLLRTLLQKMPDNLTFKQAHALKSTLGKTAKRASDLNTKRLYRQTSRILDSSMGKTARNTGSDTYKSWRKVDTNYQKHMLFEDLTENVLKKTYYDIDINKRVPKGEVFKNYLDLNKADLLASGLKSKHYENLQTIAKAAMAVERQSFKGTTAANVAQLMMLGGGITGLATGQVELGTSSLLAAAGLPYLASYVLSKPYVFESAKTAAQIAEAMSKPINARTAISLIGKLSTEYLTQSEEDEQGE